MWDDPPDYEPVMKWPSMGEMRDDSKECRCQATNVLYWELSEANPSNCPVHLFVWAIKRNGLVVAVTSDAHEALDADEEPELIRLVRLESVIIDS